jgi:hypothetical protein
VLVQLPAADYDGNLGDGGSGGCIIVWGLGSVWAGQELGQVRWILFSPLFLSVNKRGPDLFFKSQNHAMTQI